MPVFQKGIETDFDTALGVAGLTTSSAVFDKGILPFYRQSSRPTAFFGPCLEQPYKVPFIADMNRRQFSLSSSRPIGLIETSSRLLGPGSRRSLLGEAGQDYIQKAKLGKSLEKILGQMKDMGLIKTPIPSVAAVPEEVQKAAAVVLEAAVAMVDYRRAAFADVPDLAAAYKQVAAGSGEPDNPLAEKRALAIQEQADMAYLYAAAQDVAAAVTYAEASLHIVGLAKAYDFKLDTDWGQIRLTGGGDTVHDGSAKLLVIDTGGNDTYINSPCNSSPSNWISVVIDSNGNDSYLSDPALAKTSVADWPLRGKARWLQGPGSSLFGITFLVDSTGDDLYRSTRSAFGSATFGASYLGDYGGNDVYDSYGDSEGFGHYGIGILDDTAGSDKYRGFTQVQGVGLPQGLGILVDQSGDDIYEANDKVLDFPSAQSADHNNSMSQGAGYGFRADYLTGHSQSGGIGILYDLEGTDSYSCGVFGQGVGYWEGVGMLWDESGKDSYSGLWYVQGAAAHFGVGYLEDTTGDDSYQATMNMAQGAGHDFSLGMLIDREGNDTHEAPGLSLGAGNANGIGVFVDSAGNDVYKSSGITLGQAAEAQKASMRERALCLGLFIDTGGTDTYPDATTWARNSTRSANWNVKRDNLPESQVGVFLDR